MFKRLLIIQKKQ